MIVADKIPSSLLGRAAMLAAILAVAPVHAQAKLPAPGQDPIKTTKDEPTASSRKPSGLAKETSKQIDLATPGVAEGRSPPPTSSARPILQSPPPLDTSAPPPMLPRASRERMRACAEEWEKKKRVSGVQLPMWRNFATDCLQR